MYTFGLCPLMLMVHGCLNENNSDFYTILLVAITLQALKGLKVSFGWKNDGKMSLGL